MSKDEQRLLLQLQKASKVVYNNECNVMGDEDGKFKWFTVFVWKNIQTYVSNLLKVLIHHCFAQIKTSANTNEDIIEWTVHLGLSHHYNRKFLHMEMCLSTTLEGKGKHTILKF